RIACSLRRRASSISLTSATSSGSGAATARAKPIRASTCGASSTSSAGTSAGLPRTVLHIVDGLGLSGKTRNLVSVVSQIDRRRFSPIVCRLNEEPSPLVSQLAAACVPLYSIPCADGVNAGAALRIVRLARSVRADVVHCHNPRPMLYGGLAARVLGIRAVGF